MYAGNAQGGAGTQEKVRLGEPQAIEQALSALRQASLASAGPGALPVRATMLNLVAYAGTREAAGEMACWAAELADRHPLRALLLGSEPTRGAGDWDIAVSARCQPAVPGYTVCFEAVEIIARGEALERLPAIVNALLLPELPVVLYWPGDPPLGAPLFERLRANAERLVVDTASAGDPEGMLGRLAGLGHAEHCVCALGDLNWDRLTPWRELTAQFFDAPDCRPCLETLQRARLEYVGPGGGAEACLLAGWLATRLGWVPEPGPQVGAATGGWLRLRRRSEPVVVELAPLEAAARTPGLYSLVLQAHRPEGTAVLSIRALPGLAEAEVETALPGREVRRRVVPFPLPGPVQLLGQELDKFGYDTVYEDALHMAAFLCARP